MIVTGGNTLKLALSVLGKQAVSYYATSGRTLNINGVYEVTYATPVTIYGSLQPMERTLMEQMGLEFNKSYVTFYISRFIQDVTRASAGDQFTYAGRRYQVLNDTNWFNVDGWVGLTASDIGAA